MAIVTIAHELCGAVDTPATLEMQTYILLGGPSAAAKAEKPPTDGRSAHHKMVQPDATLLFQYLALGFNSHKIHIDRAWAREVEGLPDLVVNGGLVSLLLTEFLRKDLKLTLVGVKASLIMRAIGAAHRRCGDQCSPRIATPVRSKDLMISCVMAHLRSKWCPLRESNPPYQIENLVS
jgi:hypothetical protein